MALRSDTSTATYTDAVRHNTHYTQAGAVLARSAPIIPVTPTVSSRTLAAAAGIQSVLQTPLSSVLCTPAAHTYINTVPHIPLPANTINMHTCTAHTSLPACIATTTATAPIAAVVQHLPHTADVSSVPLIAAAAATTTFTPTSAAAAVDVLSSHSVTIATCAQPLQPFINTATTTPALVQCTTTFSNTPLVTQSIPLVTTTTTTCLQPLTTTISGTTAAATPAATVPVAPLLLVKQQQLPKPYNGSTSWRSFKDHFERIARVNAWSTHADKVQNLTLALEGPAAEILKDVDESSDNAYNDIWTALSRRFGHIDEARELMHRFDNRKQNETETLAEYEQALRSLYREAWPKAPADQRDSALKRKFEDGLALPEMQQFLRLHARNENFSGTVAKARQFADANEATKVKKSVRLVVQPEHEAHQAEINNVGSDQNFKPLLDGFKTIIDLALKNNNQNSTSRDISSSPSRTDNVRALSRSPSPAPRFGNNFDSRAQRFGSRPNDTTNQSRSGLFSPRPGNIGQQPRYGFGSRSTQRSPNRIGPSRPGGYTGAPRQYNNMGPQLRPNPASQSVLGQGRPVSPGTSRPTTPTRRNRGCWVCGYFGCHSDFHAPQQTPPTPPSPVAISDTSQTQGNVSRSPRPGARTPPFQNRPHSQ